MRKYELINLELEEETMSNAQKENSKPASWVDESGQDKCYDVSRTIAEVAEMIELNLAILAKLCAPQKPLWSFLCDTYPTGCTPDTTPTGEAPDTATDPD